MDLDTYILINTLNDSNSDMSGIGSNYNNNFEIGWVEIESLGTCD